MLCAGCLAGCGRSGDPASGQEAGPATATRYPLPDLGTALPCLTPEEQAGIVTFRSGNGALLAGLQFGTGHSGVVLVDMKSSSMCNWADYARSLASRGTAAFVLDLNGSGLSQLSDDFFDAPDYGADVAAAVNTFRDSGVRSIALAGASLGGTAAVVAAADLGDAVTRVAELSGDATADGLDAIEAAGRLEVPLLCLAGGEDPGTADAARRMCDAATSAPSSDVVIAPDSSLHGTHLLGQSSDPDVAEIKARLDAFLAG
jgi:dienelactone hydrolase